MVRKQYHVCRQYDAEALEYMRVRSRSNLVWQSLDVLNGLMDGSITNLRKVKSLSSGQRRSLRAEGVISYEYGDGCRHVVTELGKSLILLESNGK